MTILAIETSCDETAAAALRDFSGVLASVIDSQTRRHAPFGGVVPEIASRSHLEVLPAVLGRVVEQSGIALGVFDAYASTAGPGLAPALLVGASAARGLAAGAGKPFLPLNHLEGHLLSPFFGGADIPAHCALVVSGGHTLFFDVEGFRRYKLLGRTRDDAAGEAFDKVAKLLGLGYPGGPEIERLAGAGDPRRYALPRAMIDQPGCEVSFSGLKTAVRVLLAREQPSLPDLCASFQEAIADTLAVKLARAASSGSRKLAALSGGVSANSRVVQRCSEELARRDIELRVAPKALCGDNALMIAYTAALALASGEIISEIPSGIAPQFQPLNFPSLQLP